ncbi:MAG: glycosyl hydrolase [Kofleriaceae bacterium]
MLRARAIAFVLVAACGGAPADVDAPPGADDAAPAVDGGPRDAGWGERCGDGRDDDGDGLVDEDCPPSLFAGAYAPELVADADVIALEAAAGRALTVIQTYRSMSALGLTRLGEDLDAIFGAGRVAHVNVEPLGYAPAELAAPTAAPVATDLAAMAQTVAGRLAAHPRGRVLLTFVAEMNGDWTPWGCMAAADLIALWRAAHVAVDDALAAAAIDRRRVRWVYGPNNTSSAACGSAAGYYPGHAWVDLLGMSSYRSGTATVADTVVAPAAALLDAVGVASAWRRDRFVVLQTGTRAVAGDDRGAWVTALHTTLADDDRFAGVIYFQSADWRIPPSAPGWDAWGAAIAALPPSDVQLDGVFAPWFWDVAQADAGYPEIQALRAAGITTGCASAPARFCPDEPLRRIDAAVLLARAFTLPDGAGASPFADLADDDPALGAVLELTTRGALAPCATSPARLCPTDAITEGDLAMAVTALGGTAPAALDAPATRARGAVFIARGAALPPDAL